MGRAAEVFWRFSQSASREKVFIPKGGFTINQHEVKSAVQAEVLQTIIENEEITAKSADSVTPAAHAIFFHYDSHASEIISQHKGLISRCLGI
jgi:hypothetical protein